MQVKKQQLELEMEQQTGSTFRKEYIKAVCSYIAYLTQMQSKSCEMHSWMKHKLESRMQGEISIRQKVKSLLMKVKEESEKAGFKFNIQ